MSRPALALFGATIAVAALATACPGPLRLVGTPSPAATVAPAATPTVDPTIAAAASALGAVHTPTGRICVTVDVVGQKLEIGDDDFAQIDASMQHTIDLAQQGDVASATAVFLHEVHAFTHVIDVPLRDEDTDLGTNLYDTVYELESGIALGQDSATLARHAADVRELLRAAAEALGCAG